MPGFCGETFGFINGKFYSESSIYGFLQVLHDGSKELAQNETDSLKYVISNVNKVWICHFNVFYFALSKVIILKKQILGI